MTVVLILRLTWDIPTSIDAVLQLAKVPPYKLSWIISQTSHHEAATIHFHLDIWVMAIGFTICLCETDMHQVWQKKQCMAHVSGQTHK